MPNPQPTDHKMTKPKCPATESRRRNTNLLKMISIHSCVKAAKSATTGRLIVQFFKSNSIVGWNRGLIKQHQQRSDCPHDRRGCWSVRNHMDSPGQMRAAKKRSGKQLRQFYSRQQWITSDDRSERTFSLAAVHGTVAVRSCHIFNFRLGIGAHFTIQLAEGGRGNCSKISCQMSMRFAD